LPRPERRALIIGCAGQDGRLLFEERSRSCAVLGFDLGQRRIHGLETEATRELPPLLDIHDSEAALALVGLYAPDQLYYLAARHHSSEERPDDASELRESMRVNVLAFVNVIEAVRQRAPRCRVFYAGSSHMFGSPTSRTQNEQTPFAPENPYAISKVAGAQVCALYRARHSVHASVGLLYNHESPLRAERFVSQRIAFGARRAAKDPAFKLSLGSLSSVVDWGYAPDYVDAMVRIVSEDAPDDYVIATGEPHTVQDFVEAAFGAVGADWRAHVVVDRGRVGAPAATRTTSALVGDASKLRTRTGWKTSVTFEEMVKILVDAAAP
jgi:GDPmannose 4,6-dehydratase